MDSVTNPRREERETLQEELDAAYRDGPALPDDEETDLDAETDEADEDADLDGDGDPEPGDEAVDGDDPADQDDLDDDEDYDDEDEDDDQGRALAGGPVDAGPEPDLEGLVHYVVSRLVADPEAIEIYSEQRGGTRYIGLRVPEADLGRVIGRGGRTAQAIRTLVSIAGSKSNVHARLDIDG